MSNLADAGRLAVDQKAMDRPRRIWTTDEIEALFALPFNDLLFRAQQAHRERHDPNAVQVSTLYGTQLDTVPADFGVELTMENIYLASPQFTDLSIVWRARCFVANCLCGTATHAICALHRIQPDAAKSPNCDEAKYRAAPERNSRKTTKLRESQSGRDC